MRGVVVILEGDENVQGIPLRLLDFVVDVDDTLSAGESIPAFNDGLSFRRSGKGGNVQ